MTEKADAEEILVEKDGLYVINSGSRNGGISGIISDSMMQDLMMYLKENI